MIMLTSVSRHLEIESNIGLQLMNQNHMDGMDTELVNLHQEDAPQKLVKIAHG